MVKMHVDYVCKIYIKHKFPKHADAFDDLTILKILAIDDFVDYCGIHGDEFVKSVSETMKVSAGYRNNGSKIRKKITDKQKFVIANFLLNKFNTASCAIANVFNIEEDSIKGRSE